MWKIKVLTAVAVLMAAASLLPESSVAGSRYDDGGPGVRVRAPGTRVHAGRRGVHVRAPYAHVRVGDDRRGGGVRVRAPFTDLDIDW